MAQSVEYLPLAGPLSGSLLSGESDSPLPLPLPPAGALKLMDKIFLKKHIFCLQILKLKVIWWYLQLKLMTDKTKF